MQSSAHQSLANSPMYAPPSPSVNGMGSVGIASIASPDSAPRTGELSSAARNGWRASDPGSIAGNGTSVSTAEDEAKGRGVVGLGLGLPPSSSQVNGAKARPSQLVLSPSDSALGEKST
ncbi:hypothetical protein NUW54_g13819 [Trametes sanguinea]|uniref:Uncharacterized protein n=1 Tax=Trametes sanguinea TaxID=158606 RepID=A0ACC1MI54_9APHY|nr:hypothetical protein NUW54_g13819 [Trametes sanguinea]